MICACAKHTFNAERYEFAIDLIMESDLSIKNDTLFFSRLVEHAGESDLSVMFELNLPMRVLLQ